MSRAGVLGPLRMSQRDAEIVGSLIATRTEGFGLDKTPLAALPSFGVKLCAASKRRRRSGSTINLWTVERAEALAGFHYLVFFSHPEAPSDFLTPDESESIGEVCLTLARLLLAKRGPKGLDPAAVESRVLAWDQPLAAEEQGPVDRRFTQRLKGRKNRRDILNRTPLRPLPRFVLALMSPRKITGN
jgi:hypothetical protein